MTNHSWGGTPMAEANCCEARKEELCASALAHYDDISTKACHWHNQIPQAIRFWYLDKPRIEAELSAAQSALAEKERELEQIMKVKLPIGGQCATCGFRYWEHKGHIIACPLCRVEAAEARAGEAENNTIERCAKAAADVPHSTPFASRVITACIVAIRSLKSAPPASPAEQDK